MAKTNTIRSNSLQTNSVRLNGVEGLRRVSLQAGEIPDIPPTYTLSASVTNGMVSAKRNGSAVNLPFTANEGDVIVVSVTPNDGYAFEGWADGNTDNPRTITMNADVALSAQCVEVVVPPVEPPVESNYIQFADAEVERVLMSKGVSSDGVGITMEDAEKVTNMQGWFKNNTAIRTFNELQYFTGLTTLSQDIFFGSSLEAVTFPATMTAFGNYCFYQLAGMDTLEIPATITTIGTYLLSDSSVVKVIMRATTPPAIAGYTFRFHRGAVSIYVPDASLEAYKTATNWVDMAAYIHPLSEIEGSPYIQFEDAEVERVLMANGVSSDGIGITKEDAAAVTSIETWFRGNTAITSFNELKYFTGVTELTASAMQNCSALVSANLDNIQYLRGSSLNNTGIDKMYLPSVKTISGSALSSCKFSVILLGKNLTNIENYAIRINSILHTAICLATTPPSCAKGNFTSFSALASVYVPDASVETYKTASEWSGVASKFKGISQLATDNPSLYSEIEKYL